MGSVFFLAFFHKSMYRKKKEKLQAKRNNYHMVQINKKRKKIFLLNFMGEIETKSGFFFS